MSNDAKPGELVVCDRLGSYRGAVHRFNSHPDNPNGIGPACINPRPAGATAAPHPEGQSPVQPTCEDCGRSIDDCFHAFSISIGIDHTEGGECSTLAIARLRVENAALVAGAAQSALLHELSRKSDRAISEALLAAGAPNEGPFSERIKALGNKIARLLKAADDLCFECDGVLGTRAPSVATYNRAFDVISEMKKP